MAIFTPSESPAIITKEVDLSGVVPNVQSTTGAIVGDFRWGPVNEPCPVANETELVSKFAKPNDGNSVDFHSAAYYLRYSSDLLVIREIDSAVANNAFDSDAVAVKGLVSGANAEPTVKNKSDFDTQISTLDNNGHTFIGKYPGTLGNSLAIHMCLPDSATASSVPFNSWAYKSSFDAAPGTSSYATGRGALNDEIHVAVVDSDGEFSGTKGTVLETYPFVSVASNAKNADGSTNYVKNIINNASNYIWMAGFDSDMETAGAGSAAGNLSDFKIAPSSKLLTKALGDGKASSALTFPSATDL